MPHHNPVSIYVRVRPPKEGEEISPAVALDTEEGIITIKETTPEGEPSRHVRGDRFKFTGVFDAQADAAEVYQGCVAHIPETVFAGYNCTVMAYGQTGSGKTHTMTGYYDQSLQDERRGVIPRLLEDIFQKAQERRQEWMCNIEISNVQVYMEKVLDLLSEKTLFTTPEKTKTLPLRERTLADGTCEVFVEGATWKKIKTTQEALHIMEDGNKRRVTSSTNMNEVSSRSHSVLILKVEQHNLETAEHLVSYAYLVDLAGSETVRRTGAEGLTFQQACMVNKSLSSLSSVINALAEQGKRKPRADRRRGSATITHIPYRDSKLTRLLTHALGGNSRMVMILTCSKSASNLVETNSTLQFGRRALDLPNKPKVNRMLSLEEYKAVIAKMEITLKKQQRIIRSLEAQLAGFGLSPEYKKKTDYSPVEIITTTSEEEKKEEEEDPEDDDDDSGVLEHYLTPDSRSALRDHMVTSLHTENSQLTEQIQEGQSRIAVLTEVLQSHGLSCTEEGDVVSTETFPEATERATEVSTSAKREEQDRVEPDDEVEQQKTSDTNWSLMATGIILMVFTVAFAAYLIKSSIEIRLEWILTCTLLFVATGLMMGSKIH